MSAHKVSRCSWRRLGGSARRRAMWSQRCNACSREIAGFMAALRRCSISEVSRQRQRRGIGRERIAPGKKALGQGDQCLDQNGDQELALQPSLGTLRVDFFKMTERQQRLETLEGQFHLPSAAIDFEDGWCRDVCLKGSEHA